jgi:hypothetical protein
MVRIAVEWRAQPVDQLGSDAAFRCHTVEPNLLDEKQSAAE